MTVALVLGRGKDVFVDIDRAKALGPIDFVLATGPIAVDYCGKIDCWVWFHTEQFARCALLRERKGYPPVGSYWSVLYQGRVRDNPRDFDINYVKWNEGGSSGMVAVVVALQELRANKIILCGIPMTAEGGRYDDGKEWHEAEAHRPSWLKHKPMLEGRVKSFSGWTRELLGEPTIEWLNGVTSAAA